MAIIYHSVTGVKGDYAEQMQIWTQSRFLTDPNNNFLMCFPVIKEPIADLWQSVFGPWALIWTAMPQQGYRLSPAGPQRPPARPQIRALGTVRRMERLS